MYCQMESNRSPKVPSWICVRRVVAHADGFHLLRYPGASRWRSGLGWVPSSL